MTEANVVVFDVLRAEKFIADYEAGLVSRDDTKNKLIAAFGLDDAGAEIVLEEIDAQ